MKKHCVYLIRNKINGKVYIGRTSRYDIRVKEHYRIAFNEGYEEKKNRPLYVDMVKFGWENFEFTILEDDLTLEESTFKEEFYIKEYRSTYSEFGYNKKRGEAIGGKGYYKYDDTIMDCVFELLANEEVSLEEIANRTGVTLVYLRDINSGYRSRREGISYPIRNIDKRIGECLIEEIIELLKNTNMTQKEIAKKLNIARSTVTMINIGHNNYQEGLDYPIRKKKSN